MAMDYLRSTYSSKMRLYNDRPDVEVEGAWFFCQPGAKVLPIAHVFASQNWTPEGVHTDPPLGEVAGPRKWTNGIPDTRFTGQHFCGSPEVWLHGIPFAERPGLVLEPDGTPACCKAPRAIRRETSGGDLAIDATAQGDNVFSGAKARSNNLLPLSLGLVNVTFSSVLWDTDAYFDLDANPILMTPPRDGVYAMGVEVSWDWLGTPDPDLTLHVVAKNNGFFFLVETQGITPQDSITTVAFQSPAVEVRLYEALPVHVELFLIGGASNLVDLRATLWVEFRGDPPPVLVPFVTGSGDTLVTGSGFTLAAQS
jgi:hypothetical protein